MRPKINWLLVISIPLIVLLIGVFLPFLPGPHSLYSPVQILFFLCQTISTLGLMVVLPVTVIWLLIELIRLVFGKIKKISKALIYLLILSVFLFLINWAPSGLFHITDFARGHAIKNSYPLIHAIESYKEKQGVYPENLDKLIPDFISEMPHTGIIGIPEFVYEKTETSYELSFYQNIILLFNSDITIYSPDDTQKSNGGLPELYETKFPHWKYYIYD